MATAATACGEWWGLAWAQEPREGLGEFCLESCANILEPFKPGGDILIGVLEA